MFYLYLPLMRRVKKELGEGSIFIPSKLNTEENIPKYEPFLCQVMSYLCQVMS